MMRLTATPVCTARQIFEPFRAPTACDTTTLTPTESPVKKPTTQVITSELAPTAAVASLPSVPAKSRSTVLYSC